MDKVNNPYAGQTIYFATQHQKEEILAPLFGPLEIRCERVEVDTDQFGTFSGEIERQGSIRETLRQKIAAGRERAPHARLILASEGSFGPDPFLGGLVQSDLESLLLWDRELDHEIYAEFLARSPVHAEMTLGPRDDFRQFLKNIQFPDHRVIVHPENSVKPVLKGLSTENEVSHALLECFWQSSNGRVVIATDLRAHQNKTRRLAILEAGRVLCERMTSPCPECAAPGFAITRGIPGLPCEGCGEPSRVAASVLYECGRCGFSRSSERPDGLKVLSIDECEHCNP